MTRPSDRWTRPLNGEDMFALTVIWLACFAVIVASIWLFQW